MTMLLYSLLKLNADRQFDATLDLGWRNKWGNMPDRFQPIPADLDLAKTA